MVVVSRVQVKAVQAWVFGHFQRWGCPACGLDSGACAPGSSWLRRYVSSSRGGISARASATNELTPSPHSLPYLRCLPTSELLFSPDSQLTWSDTLLQLVSSNRPPFIIDQSIRSDTAARCCIFIASFAGFELDRNRLLYASPRHPARNARPKQRHRSRGGPPWPSRQSPDDDVATGEQRREDSHGRRQGQLSSRHCHSRRAC